MDTGCAGEPEVKTRGEEREEKREEEEQMHPPSLEGWRLPLVLQVGGSKWEGGILAL